MKLRKILSVILALALGCSLFAAAAAADSVKNVELVTWSNAASIEFLNEIKDEFHAAYPQYNLVVTEVPSSDIDTVNQTRMIAHDVDIICLQTLSKPQEDWNANMVSKPAWQDYIDNGLLMDLTDCDFIANYNLDTLMGNSYHDRIYTLNMGTVAYTGVFYNKAIFAELGLSIPQTWDEYIAVCEAIKADGQYDVITTSAATQWTLNIYGAAIATAQFETTNEIRDFTKKLLTAEISHADPEMLDIYNCMYQFVSYMEPGTQGIDYADVYGRFSLGTIAMVTGGSYDAPSIDAAEPEFEYGYFPLPGIKARADGLEPQYGIKYDLGFSVVNDGPNTDGALAFLSFISQKDVYTRFINAISFSPTQDDVEITSDFLASLSGGLQKPLLNLENLDYRPNGVGSVGKNHLRFWGFDVMGGEYAAVGDFAAAVQADWDAALEANASLAK